MRQVRRTTKRLLGLIMLYVVIMTICQCNSPTGGDPLGEAVRGTVLDSVSGSTLDSVEIRVNDTLALQTGQFSDSTGHFFADAGFGQTLRIVHFSKVGFKSKYFLSSEISSAIMKGH